MESGKRCIFGSETKTVTAKTVAKCRCPGDKHNNKGRAIKKEFQKNEMQSKISMIPVLKGEKIDLKSVFKKPGEPSDPFQVSCSCCCNKKKKELEDFDLKLKILEEKEKSVAEYYQKIEDKLREMVVQGEKHDECEPQDRKTPQSTCARKMTSDPSVFTTVQSRKNALSDFENNIEQISNIWLKTSADLYKTLKNLKKNPQLDPIEVEVENVRIQLAIKQAKSLTLIKTRSVIAEAKKIFNHGEMIRNHLEKFLSCEALKLEDGKRGHSEGERQEREVEEMCQVVNVDKHLQKTADGTGDTSKGSEAGNIEGTNDNEKLGEKNEEQEKEESKLLKINWPKENPAPTDKSSEKQLAIPQCSCSPSETIVQEVENLAAELARKNETITNLNGQIFGLQKACNEHLLRYNQLQLKLSEFHEKIQWNQVLWKQIKKLKDRIQGLQQSNKQLEANKKELECKISKLDKELERLIKLNHILNQRKCLLSAQEYSSKDCKIRDRILQDTEEKYIRNTEYSEDDEEKIISDKQNAINHLKSVINAMRDQENFAQKQIAVFQSKIEALERRG